MRHNRDEVDLDLTHQPNLEGTAYGLVQPSASPGTMNGFLELSDCQARHTILVKKSTAPDRHEF